ncbi:MAG: cupin domain-containing protein, partial [Pyrinomonadaceae bacterium]
MKYIYFFCSTLIFALVSCNQSQTQSAETKPVATPTVQTQQATKPDPNNPATWADSLDAVVAAPKNHKVVLENDKVRVLEVTVQPGEKEPVHAHKWSSVLYVMEEENIRDYDADGNLLYDTKTDKNPMKTPYTIWMEPQAPHSVENLSKKPLRLMRVEL